MSDDDETTFQWGSNTFSDCTIVGEDGIERPLTKASLLANMKASEALIWQRSIEASTQADWNIALDGLLPEGVEPYPQQVAAYIRQLQSRLPS